MVVETYPAGLEEVDEGGDSFTAVIGRGSYGGDEFA